MSSEAEASKAEAVAWQSLADAVLLDREGGPVKAVSLWQKQPCLILCMRRPGCILCRAEAKRLWGLHKVIRDELGIRMVVVVHEFLQTEIQAFAPAFWAGEVLYDKDKAVFQALGNGKIRKGSMLTFLNPWNRVYKNTSEARQEVTDFNFKGDASVLGGMMVIKPASGKMGAQLEYIFLEKAFGDHAQHDEVLAACRRAAGRE